MSFTREQFDSQKNSLKGKMGEEKRRVASLTEQQVCLGPEAGW